ncbi:unnamed protein product [Bursaphelenchus okinawaensis]|uniref:Uncharacterized protein n=1 Tax=Bursaphelenchus okinawaensis TaxID=465554 RepID=A0A811KQY7_9BILA|nr:unnamed protein product [Bursaphelenchus okinawaensis]CAG9109250.1 unnamed protein product [Bursaphelenchus okinawaensis]
MFSIKDDDWTNNSAFSEYNDFSYDRNVGSYCWKNSTDDYINDLDDAYDDYCTEKKDERQKTKKYWALAAIGFDSLYGSSNCSTSTVSSCTSSKVFSIVNFRGESDISYGIPATINDLETGEKRDKSKVAGVVVSDPKIAWVKPYHVEDDIVSETSNAPAHPHKKSFVKKLIFWCH